jgi:hypothetical protein
MRRAGADEVRASVKKRKKQGGLAVYKLTRARPKIENYNHRGYSNLRVTAVSAVHRRPDSPQNPKLKRFGKSKKARTAPT